MGDYGREKAGLWFNIYMLFALVWSDRMGQSDPAEWLWWFYVPAFLASALGAGIQFGVVLQQSFKSRRHEGAK